MRALLRSVVSRLAQGLVLLLALSFALFGLLQRLPGDPVELLVASDPSTSAAEVARLRHLRGLDSPFAVQWWRWLVGTDDATHPQRGAVFLVVGATDALGFSHVTKRPVQELLFGPAPVCGDGHHDAGEGCDDGNVVDDDGCSAVCVPRGVTFWQRVDLAVVGAVVNTGRVQNTLLLTVPALCAALALALALGARAALRGGVVDVVIRAAAGVLASTPAWLVATALVWCFAEQLRWLPAGGLAEPGLAGQGAAAVLVDRLRHACLPFAVLVLAWTARFVRPVHAAVLVASRAPHVTTARARGVAPRDVVVRHILPHAALPLVTLLGLSLPSLVGGALLTETVFSWPGLGRLHYDAILQNDAWVAVVVFLATAALVVAGSALADAAAFALDPRSRTAWRRGSP